MTRTGSDQRLGADFRQQVFGRSQPLLLAAGVLLALGAFPGLPKTPFVILGAGLGGVAWRMRRAEQTAEQEAVAPRGLPAAEGLEALLSVEPLAVEVGLGLVSMVEGAENSPLLRRIASIRRQLVGDLGFVLPPVRVTDDLSLRAREYRVSLKGAELARYELPQAMELALATASAEAPAGGVPTREPAFGLTAWWIPASAAESARHQGYTVVDAVSVLTTHLAELARRHAYELFSRQEAKKLLDRVAVEHPRVVEDLVPKLLPLATVQRVLQNLLRERVSIRDAVSILESLGEAAGTTRNPVLLTEYVRQSLRRTLVKPFLNAQGELTAYLIDPALDQVIEAAVEHGEQASTLALAPQVLRDVMERVARQVGRPEAPVAAISSGGARPFWRQIVEPSLSNVFFLAHSEVPAGVKVVSLGLIA